MWRLRSRGELPGPETDIYIADTLNYRVRMIDHSTGFIHTIAGDGDAGDGDRGAGRGQRQRRQPALEVSVTSAACLSLSRSEASRQGEPPQLSG